MKKLEFQIKKLEGNERFEGFAIDLMSEIAKFLQFNITFKLVNDGKLTWGRTKNQSNQKRQKSYVLHFV